MLSNTSLCVRKDNSRIKESAWTHPVIQKLPSHSTYSCTKPCIRSDRSAFIRRTVRCILNDHPSFSYVLQFPLANYRTLHITNYVP